MSTRTQIKIKGHLDKHWQEWFEGLEFSYEEENTILTGYIKDEAFMHGILNKLRDLNFKLISINPIDDNYIINFQSYVR